MCGQQISLDASHVGSVPTWFNETCPLRFDRCFGTSSPSLNVLSSVCDFPLANKALSILQGRHFT